MDLSIPHNANNARSFKARQLRLQPKVSSFGLRFVRDIKDRKRRRLGRNPRPQHAHSPDKRHQHALQREGQAEHGRVEAHPGVRADERGGGVELRRQRRDDLPGPQVDVAPVVAVEEPEGEGEHALEVLRQDPVAAALLQLLGRAPEALRDGGGRGDVRCGVVEEPGED